MVRGFAIKVIAWRRNPERLVHWTVPAYLVAYDPDARSGRGRVTWSPDLSRAMVFSVALDAVRMVERPSRYGRRPLAERYIVEIEEVSRDE